MRGIGLVLAGGGGKGAYQIGVWKALEEYGITKRINAVSGTSVGALNAALFAQGDYKIAESLWLRISSDKILKISVLNIMKIITNLNGGIPAIALTAFANRSMFSRNGLLDMMDESLNFESISNSGMPCYATCLGVPGMKREYFNLQCKDENTIRSILLASSALPGIFDDVEINGKRYIDGGVPSVGDNIPIQPLYDLGHRLFIAVHLSRTDILDTRKFTDAKIIQVIPREDQGSLFSGTLDFSPEGASKRIEQGYIDTCAIMKPLYEIGMTQQKTTDALEKLFDDEKRFNTERAAVLVERDKLKEEQSVLLNYIIRS